MDQVESLDIDSNSPSDNHLLFDKFEKSLQIKTAGKLTEYLKENIDEIWYPLLESYDTVDGFFNQYKSEDVSEFEKTKNIFLGLLGLLGLSLPCALDIRVRHVIKRAKKYM